MRKGRRSMRKERREGAGREGGGRKGRRKEGKENEGSKRGEEKGEGVEA